MTSEELQALLKRAETMKTALLEKVERDFKAMSPEQKAEFNRLVENQYK